MEQTELSFSRDEARKVLTDFASFFQKEETAEILKQLGNEAKISQYIEQSQKKIFKQNGIDPERGFQDLKRVTTVFMSEGDIMQLVLYTALKEEILTAEALGTNSKATEQQKQFVSKYECKQIPQGLRMPSGFQTDEEFKAAQNNPQKMQRFYLDIQQQLMQWTAEQRENFANSLMSNLGDENVPLLQKKLVEQMMLLPKDQQEAFRSEMSRVLHLNVPSPSTMQKKEQNIEDDPNATSHMKPPMQGPQSKELFKKR